MRLCCEFIEINSISSLCRTFSLVFEGLVFFVSYYYLDSLSYEDPDYICVYLINNESETKEDAAISPRTKTSSIDSSKNALHETWK